MDQTIAEEYKSSLNDLNFNSKPLINMLTMLAEDNKKHAALITSTIINHINSVSPESKLPGLYLVDSIMKNVGEHYLKMFCHHITSLFTSVFEKVDETTRSLMFKLRQTWNDILPNKILYNLDTSVKKLDNAWPVTAKNVPKKIMIHPTIRAVTTEQKSNLNSQCISQKEDKPKPSTDVLLKKLLADQEQLRQIEMRKVQQTMKKKPPVSVDSVHGKVLKQNQIQDPKMIKVNKAAPVVMSLKGNLNIAQRKVAPVIMNTFSPTLYELAPVTGKPLLLQSASPSFTTSVPENSDKSTIGSVKFLDQQVSSQKKCPDKSKRKPHPLENESLKSTTLKQDNPINKNPRNQNATSLNNPLNLLQKKVTERTKTEKINVSKNKSEVSFSPYCKKERENKCASQLKINLNEKIKNFNKADRCQNKSKILNKDLTKAVKCSPKKKTVSSGNLKHPELSSNIHIYPHQQKGNELKISKRKEKVKPLTCTDILPIAESKVSITEDKKCVSSSFKNEKIKQNTFPIPNETFGNKCIQPANETIDFIHSNTHPVVSSLNYPSLNDKDLRISSVNDKDLRVKISSTPNVKDLREKIGSTPNVKDLKIGPSDSDLGIGSPSIDKDFKIGSTNNKDLRISSTNDKDLRIGSTNEKDLRIGSTNDKDLRIGSNDKDLRIGSNDKDLRIGSNDKDLRIASTNDKKFLRIDATNDKGRDLRIDATNDKGRDLRIDATHTNDKGRDLRIDATHTNDKGRDLRIDATHTNDKGRDLRIDATHTNDKERDLRIDATNDKDLRIDSTNDKDLRTASTNDKDLRTASANDKNLRIPSMNDKDLRIPSTNDKDLRIPSTNDKDLRIPSTNDKDLRIPSTNDKDLRIASTDDKDLIIASTNDKDLRICSTNDKDLRIDSTTPNMLSCLKFPISEIKDNVTIKEVDKGEPPQKKIKIEDDENLNPDQREPGSPVLFGNEDQDLRKLKESSILTDDLKEHPAVLVNQKVIDEMFIPEKDKREPTNFRNQKYRTRYPSRGRYMNRSIHRSHINRHQQCLYDANIGSMIKQAEVKYNSGKISEKEYADLRHELQKMLESSEYQRFKNSISKLQAVDHNQQIIPKAAKHVQDYQHRSNVPSEELPIQGPSVPRPPLKPFVLDNKSRFIYFIEDRAFVLMDNNEPRELTFTDEPRKVLIEGLTEPLTLGFNGKSVEFEVDGRRHIIRFGVPGHEIYINNHPYEANFGGPPIKAMLEDGCVYKISLMGPPPQVIIGNKPEYELFAKYHSNFTHSVFEKLPETREIKSEILDVAPVSIKSGALRDIDMRIKPENAQQSDILLSKDSPFYSENLKDVDWRIPPSNNVVIDKNIPDLFPETEHVANFEPWPRNIKQEVKENPFSEEENEPVTSSQEARTYEWDASTSFKTVLMNVDEREHFTPPNHETWHLRQDNVNWRHKEQHSQINHPGHSVHYQTYPVQCDSTEHLNDQNQEFIRFNRSRQYSPYPRRPMFHNRRMRGGVRGHGYGPWISNNSNRPFRSRSRPPLLNDPVTYNKRLLPFSHIRPHAPVSVNYNLPPPVISTRRGLPENYEESLNDFKPKPSESQSTESSTLDVNINVESLLEKLIAAGIINAKSDEEPSSEVTSSDCVDTDTINDSESSENIPVIELNVESLRVHHTGVSSALHSGSQCVSCGMRFKEMQGEHYSRHLDWHFRINRREKDGAKKTLSKRWYNEIEDWIQFEEFEDFDERLPSYFELEAENEQSEIADLPDVLSVPATSNDDESCPICQERFQLFWVEEEEEWHLRNAVRHDDVTYHPACYEDFKKASEAEKVAENDPMNIENSSDELLCVCDKTDIVTVLLNELLEQVCIDVEKSRISNEERLPVCSNTMEEVSLVEIEEMPSIEMEEEPSVEMEEISSLEEVILEGKPGEEEIIGMISESDIEADIEFPKTETKMVIMQSGGITLKVKAESLQCHSPSNSSEKDAKPTGDNALENDEIDFRPPTPDPNFQVMPPIKKGRELSGLCCIM